MFGCQYLLILLTVILCPSDQRAAEDFTVLTPRIVSKLLGTAKHVMLLINCNTTPPTTEVEIAKLCDASFRKNKGYLGVFIPLETLQRFCNKSHIFEGKAGDLT